MSQTKTFYLERGPINPPELHSANEDELIKIYASNDDAMTDLANMDDNEVFATRDNDYLGAVIVDKVEDGNYNPLTSNAVFDYIQDQLELSDWEVFTVSQSSGTPTEVPYDGYYNFKWSSSSPTGQGILYLIINGTNIQISAETNPNTQIVSDQVFLKKGDKIFASLSSAVFYGTQYARWYKKRDYSNRT